MHRQKSAVNRVSHSELDRLLRSGVADNVRTSEYRDS